MHSASTCRNAKIELFKIYRAINDDVDETKALRLFKEAKCAHIFISVAVVERDLTLLHWATFRDMSKLATELLNAKADVNTKDRDGRVVLHIAASVGSIDIAKILLSPPYNTNVNTRDDCGDTPLTEAFMGECDDMVKFLLNAKADINTKDKRGASLLHIAAAHDRTDVAKMLLNPSYNFDVDICDSTGATPLVYAIKGDHIDMTKLLLNAKADINAKDKRGASLLHIAAENCSYKTEEMLLRPPYNTDVNICESVGKTPLMYAFDTHQHFLAGLLLLDAKADVDPKYAERVAKYYAAVVAERISWANAHRWRD